jgi:hypothetical protein
MKEKKITKTSMMRNVIRVLLDQGKEASNKEVVEHVKKTYGVEVPPNNVSALRNQVVESRKSSRPVSVNGTTRLEQVVRTLTPGLPPEPVLLTPGEAAVALVQQARDFIRMAGGKEEAKKLIEVI